MGGTSTIEQLEERVRERTTALTETVAALGQEVAERQQVEQTVHRQAAMLEAFFRYSPKPLAVLDRHFNFIRVNEAYARADERKVEDFIGRNHFEMYPNEENEAIFREVLTTREPYQAVAKPFVYAEHPERGASYWNWAAVPIQDQAGEVEFIVFHLEDVTEQVLAERALREANEQLELRAAQLRALAAELTSAEQRERRRMATILHDHLQQLLVGAKFRAAALAGNTEPLVLQTVNEIKKLLDEAISASRSLTAELSPPIVHEGDLSAGLEWLARWMADKHGLAVELSVAQRIPGLSEDLKTVLFESLRELLFNVAKHARVPSAAVEVASAEGDELRVVVSDAGRGFDPTKLARAGERGGGFGLFSIRERLRRFGGKLEVHSTPGEGSRFVLSVSLAHEAPQAPAVADVSEVAYVSAASPAARPKASGRIRILVADDHQMMREGLVRLLSQQPDMEIAGEAADGEMAVRLAQRLRPHVVLMDLSMPRLNGLDATRVIAKTMPDIRVIGLSMFEESERAQSMVDAGASTYLAKSGSVEALISAIRAHCGHDRGSTA